MIASSEWVKRNQYESLERENRKLVSLVDKKRDEIEKLVEERDEQRDSANKLAGQLEAEEKAHDALKHRDAVKLEVASALIDKLYGKIELLESRLRDEKEVVRQLRTSSSYAVYEDLREQLDEAHHLKDDAENRMNRWWGKCVEAESELQLERERNQKLANELVIAEAWVVKFNQNRKEAEEDRDWWRGECARIRDERNDWKRKATKPELLVKVADGSCVIMQPGDEHQVVLQTTIKCE